MTLEHLKLFRDLANTKSVSRGAAMNSVSQSAASQHVQELEKQLGVKLLDRARRPLALTTEGRLYYEFCREVVRRQEEFVTALQQMKGEREGVVRVASIYSVGLTEMARLEQELARRQPGAQIKVEFLRPEKVYEAVITDQADLGLVSYPEAKREIKVIAWREEQMVVAMSPRHALAGEPKLAPEQLAGESLSGLTMTCRSGGTCGGFCARRGWK